MVDLDWKTKMISPDLPNKSPRLSNKLHVSIPAPPLRIAELAAASDAACSAYEHYLRLPDLRRLWSSTEFPSWRNESILKPTLHGLEMTFRFISTVFCDPRPYANRREWKRRLESLATNQIEIIALLCEDEEEISGAVPINGRISEASLLPRLAKWSKAEDVAQKILYAIECEMRRCPYTIGLGEPNLAGKLILDYDLLCKPLEVHSLRKSPSEHFVAGNYENQTLYTTHQMLEAWIYASQQLLQRIAERIDEKSFEKASSDCWILEKTWKLLSEIEDLHLLMDPDDFLRLKNQLSIKSTAESEPELFCLRSRGLVEITKLSKDLRHKVPEILGVEVDPKGGPRIQEAAMELYNRKEGFERIHLLQALQAIEMAAKRFYYSYKQLLVVVMGSLEAKWNGTFVTVDSSDSLGQIFLEPTNFPSLDAAKTFLGYYWGQERGRFSP